MHTSATIHFDIASQASDNLHASIGKIFGALASCMGECTVFCWRRNLVGQSAPFAGMCLRLFKLRVKFERHEASLVYTQDVCENYEESAIVLRSFRRHRVVHPADLPTSVP